MSLSNSELKVALLDDLMTAQAEVIYSLVSLLAFIFFLLVKVWRKLILALQDNGVETISK